MSFNYFSLVPKLGAKRLFLLTFPLWGSGGLFAQNIKIEEPAKYAKTILQEDLKKHLTILASDEMEGRNTGTPGQKRAAEYISNHFKSLGLSAPVKTDKGMSYLQPFSLMQRSWGDVSIETKKTKKAIFKKDKNFYVKGVSYAMRKPQTMNYVFLGNPTDEILQKTDVKDKAVFLLKNENQKLQADALRNKGAKAILIVVGKNQEEFNTDYEEASFYFERTLKSLSNPSKKETVTFYLSPKYTSEIFGVKENAVFGEIESVNKKNKDKKITLHANMTEKEEWQSENVLGFLEGTDKKEEVVVITSHYDHVGFQMKDGKKVVYNGADDDGSGTVSVLEIAEAFVNASKEGKKPRRSILFMTVAGEELGLFGSQFYADNDPIFPLKNTVVDLNIDMVGRIGEEYQKDNNPNYVYLIGSDKLSTQLHELNEEVNKKLEEANKEKFKLDYKYNDENDPNRFYYRSDHYNFAKNDIPIIFYFNGVHEDYHQPTDDVEKIHFPKMEKIARLIFHTAWEIANREQRLVVDKATKAAPKK